MARALFALVVAAFAAVPVPEANPRATLEVTPREATVGDPLEATLTVDLPAGVRLERPSLGPEIGPFTVLSGTWEGPREEAGGERWVWRGRIAAYETGSLELPPVGLSVASEKGEATVRTEPVALTIRSVLPPEKEGEPAPDLADLKPPVSIPPDYTALRRALLAFSGLLAAAGVVWWVHRRLAGRFAAMPAELDPFRRLPPHEWAYAELQRLLEGRLAEAGEVGSFFEELSRIVKRYLGARFRVGLLERTTGEVAPALRQAGMGEPMAGEVHRLLELCDRVKFAKETPGLSICRQAVEAAYGLVDRTRPVEDRSRAEGGGVADPASRRAAGPRPEEREGAPETGRGAA